MDSERIDQNVRYEADAKEIAPNIIGQSISSERQNDNDSDYYDESEYSLSSRNGKKKKSTKDKVSD